MRRTIGLVPILPRFYRRQLQAEDACKLERLLAEVGADEPTNGDRLPLRRSADGHDPARLRGLPAVGPCVSGAIPGTDPLRALLRAERRRSRFSE